MQIKIDDRYRKQLSTLTKLAGFTWGKGGSPTKALQAIAIGTHRLVPSTGSQLGQEWIEIAMDFIESKNPMSIEYQSPDGKVETFKADYAEIAWHERQYYLDIRTLTPSSDPDLPYNRCLKFDRILSIEASPGEWGEMDRILVEFQLYGGLRQSYIPRPNDIANFELQEKTIIRRQIANTFWFVREIIVYGDGCEVIYPQSVKNLVIDRLKSALDLYSKN